MGILTEKKPLLLLVLLWQSGCSSSHTPSELRPEGPPEVLQVIVTERMVDDTNSEALFQEVRQLAFGTHGEISPEREDGQVLRAVPFPQNIRIVVDELLLGNHLEEIACADGTYSRIPIGATPDDIARCAGPVELQDDCEGPLAVCVGDTGKIGILDENSDQVPDDLRMMEEAVQITCGEFSVPIDLQQSFYQPSGNQLLPVSSGVDGLGPAIIVVPRDGLPSGTECGVVFARNVVDKQGNMICASNNLGVCVPGDTTAIHFAVDTLRLIASDPADQSEGVPLLAEGEDYANIVLHFNGVMDDATLSSIQLLQLTSGGMEVTDLRFVLENGQTVRVEVPGGFQSNSVYQVQINAGDGGIWTFGVELWNSLRLLSFPPWCRRGDTIAHCFLVGSERRNTTFVGLRTDLYFGSDWGSCKERERDAFGRSDCHGNVSFFTARAAGDDRYARCV